MSGEPIYLGETIRWRCNFTDFDAGAVTPDSHAISVVDSDGTEVHSDTSPNYDAVSGKYYTDLTIPADGEVGNYTIYWTAVYGGNTWKAKKKFSVEQFS